MGDEFRIDRATGLQSLAKSTFAGAVTTLFGPVGGATAMIGTNIVDNPIAKAIIEAAGSAVKVIATDANLQKRLADAVRGSLECAFSDIGNDPAIPKLSDKVKTAVITAATNGLEVSAYPGDGRAYLHAVMKHASGANGNNALNDTAVRNQVIDGFYAHLRSKMLEDVGLSNALLVKTIESLHRQIAEMPTMIGAMQEDIAIIREQVQRLADEKRDGEVDTEWVSSFTVIVHKVLDECHRRGDSHMPTPDDEGRAGLPGSTRSHSDEVVEELQLELEIGCDGKGFVLTSQALGALATIEAIRMDGTGGQAKVGSVNFSYVDMDRIYKMLIEAESDDFARMSFDVESVGSQLLAINRNRVEKTMEQAMRFTVNDSSVDALLVRANDLIVDESKSDYWRERLHVNAYGLISPYKRAFLWARVLEQSLAILRNPSITAMYDVSQDQDCVRVYCAHCDARNTWYFTTAAHLSDDNDTERETLALLHWPTPYPCDVFDMRKSDLVNNLYPDLCWSVGELIANNPDEYDRVVREHGEKVFYWYAMRIG